MKYPDKISNIDLLEVSGIVSNVPKQEQSNVSTSVPGVVKQSPKSTINSDQYVAQELDALGRPKGFKLKEPTAAQDKRDVETKELAAQTSSLLSLFNKARKEATSVPNFGAAGPLGRISNIGAIGKAKMGFSPAINVFQDRVAAFATISAKAAGEIRPTDADIIRFSKALMNLKSNDEENAIQISQILKDIQAKGQSTVWAKDLVNEFQNITGKKVDFSFDGTNTTPMDTESLYKKYNLEK
jgi:hypothetical protein